MKKKNPKEKQRKPLLNVIVWAFMICFTATVAYCCVDQMGIYYHLKEEEKQIQQSLEAEKKKKMELNARKDYYSSDAYIEKIAREQLGLIKPNELLFINRGK